MKISKKLSSLAIASAVLAMAAGSAQGRDLTVVNFGGANGDAQEVAFIKPLEKELGKKIIAVAYNGEQAKVKAMVDTHDVVWDAVEVETGDLGRGCDEGLYEKLNWDHIGKKSDFIPAAVRECGIGAFVWSTVLAYNGKTVVNLKPVNNWLNALGEPLYGRLTPDGYGLRERDWASSGQMSKRFEIARAIGGGSAGLFDSEDGTPPVTFGFPMLSNRLFYDTVDTALSPLVRQALDKASSQAEWNAFLLASPDFMYR